MAEFSHYSHDMCNKRRFSPLDVLGPNCVYSQPSDIMTHDASSGVHHLVMHYDEDPDTPVALEKSIVIANHGCHTESSSTLKRSAFEVWFAEDSVRVSLSPLPTIEAQTTSNDRDAGLQYQLPNPLHVLLGSKQSDGCPTRCNEVLERIEEECRSGTLIKEIILMTDCLYLIEMMNRDIWIWAERDYQDEHGRKIPNWKLLKRLHEKMLELGGLSIKVDFWRVRKEENSNAEGLALEALHADEQGEGSRSGNEHKDMTIPTLRPCCEYRKETAKTDPAAQGLASRLGIEFPGPNVTGLRAGMMYPMRRMVTTGAE